MYWFTCRVLLRHKDVYLSSHQLYDRMFLNSCCHWLPWLVIIWFASALPVRFRLRAEMQLFKMKWFSFILLPIKFRSCFFIWFSVCGCNIYCNRWLKGAKHIHIIIPSELFLNWWQLFTANTHHITIRCIYRECSSVLRIGMPVSVIFSRFFFCLTTRTQRGFH